MDEKFFCLSAVLLTTLAMNPFYGHKYILIIDYLFLDFYSGCLFFKKQ